MKVKKNAYQGLILDPDDPGYKRGWIICLAPKRPGKSISNKILKNKR